MLKNIASLAPGVKDGGHAARWRLLHRIEEGGRIGAGVRAARLRSSSGSTRPDVRPTTMPTAAVSWATVRYVALLTPRSFAISVYSTSTPPVLRFLWSSAAAEKPLAEALNRNVVCGINNVGSITSVLGPTVAKQ